VLGEAASGVVGKTISKSHSRNDEMWGLQGFESSMMVIAQGLFGSNITKAKYGSNINC
jgi:hypothetical protein